MKSLAETIERTPIVLDGGLATELERQGSDISGQLWSARLLADDPASILAAHREFFAAGADVAITASYQATIEGFAAAGIDRASTVRLMRRSVELAREAADEIRDRPTWVAASVGPYGAMLADGSEYRGDYGLTVRQLRDFHRPRLDALVEAGTDVLAIETIPTLLEVEALLEELAIIDFPAWVSLSIAGPRTRSGEPLHEVFQMTADVDQVIAVGVNCSTPEDTEHAIPIAATASGKPVVAYPNSGEGWDANLRAWAGTGELDPVSAVGWVTNGARLVGGCCRVSPSQIRKIATSVRSKEAQAV